MGKFSLLKVPAPAQLHNGEVLEPTLVQCMYPSKCVHITLCGIRNQFANHVWCPLVHVRRASMYTTCSISISPSQPTRDK